MISHFQQCQNYPLAFVLLFSFEWDSYLIVYHVSLKTEISIRENDLFRFNDSGKRKKALVFYYQSEMQLKGLCNNK